MTTSLSRRPARAPAGIGAALTAAAAVVAAAVLALLAPHEALARAPSVPPQSYGSDVEAVQPFREAAAHRDPARLADQTALPFLFEGQPLGREAFMQRAVPALFTSAVRRCLQTAPPQREDGRLVLWCAPYGFYLGQVNGAWRLVEFAADTP